jgi:uncharacterized protein DUF397
MLSDQWRTSTLSHTSGCLEARWVTATASAATNCVEVTIGDEWVEVRDSKDRAGPVLRFTRREWRAFLLGARNDEFDLPAEAVPA